jgi:hypothetical protein
MDIEHIYARRMMLDCLPVRMTVSASQILAAAAAREAEPLVVVVVEFVSDLLIRIFRDSA